MTAHIADSFHIWATYALVVLAIIGFASERIRVEITSLLILVALIVLFELFPLPGGPANQGGLDTAQLLAGFSNPALIAVMALLVLGHGLSRTGALDWALRLFLDATGDRRFLAIAICFVVVFAGSAFVNNTPIVVIFIPILETVARRFSISPGTVMLPLSFAAILAGMTTLIGSSTNLLVSGALEQMGVQPLGFFDFALPGMVLAAVGLVYVALVVPRVPRQRRSPMKRITTGAHRRFVAQLTVGAGSKLIGEAARFNLLDVRGSRLILVQRKEHSHVSPFGDLEIREGDTLVILATRDALGLAQGAFPHLMFNLSGEDLPEDEEERKKWLSRDQMVTEVMITPGSRLVGQTLEEAGFRARFGCLVLGVERRSRVIRRRLTGSTLRAGDVLVVQGDHEALEALRVHRGLIVLDGATRPVPSARSAEMAGAIFAGTVAAAATGILPIAGAAIVGVALMLATGVLTVRQATAALDRRIFFMVGASLALGAAMTRTGAAIQLAHGVIGLTGDAGPAVTLSVLFLLVALLTNVLSNNATAILFTPIALGLADSLHAPFLPFALAVLFGANSSFATPIGYQTNLLVMGPGHYRFNDFLRAGTPLVLLLWIVFSFFVPWYYGLLG